MFSKYGTQKSSGKIEGAQNLWEGDIKPGRRRIRAEQLNCPIYRGNFVVP